MKELIDWSEWGDCFLTFQNVSNDYQSPDLRFKVLGSSIKVHQLNLEFNHDIV